MPEQPFNPQAPSAIQANFHELAALLRRSRHLEPEVQSELSELLDELSRALDPSALSSTETAHLATSAAHLVQSLHQEHPPGLLAAAKERLEDAAFRAEG